MKKILVPYDFSATSTSALKQGLSIAKRLNASIELLHVIELPVITEALPAFNFEGALVQELKDKTEYALTKALEKHQLQNIIVTKKLEIGPIAKTIVSASAASGFDLIVMGSHGVGAVSEFFLGSNVINVMRRAPIPLLIVKEYHEKEISTIVFPHSLEIEGQEDLVKKVVTLQKALAAQLRLVFINTPVTFASDEILKAKLDSFSSYFHLENFTGTIYNHTDESEGIEQYCKLVNGNLIAIGTQGRKGVAKLLNNSIAEQIVRLSSIPVWTYSLNN